ncbi:MAG: protein-glutamate O-methyltransferase CheR [Gemmatimonadales bacterium]
MSETEEPGFLALAQRIASRAGLDVTVYKDRCLKRRIASRMRACGVEGYLDYLDVLDQRPEELDRLLDALTINVTKFFRNRETWSWLEAHVLPTLLAERQGHLRVWSAGCASGEEPYTLAMLAAVVLERMGRGEWLARVRIDATDIDRASLERTGAGCYGQRAFDETEPAMIERFTVPLPGDQRQILPELRERVTVQRLDLTREPPISPPYDLICCRNVIIYFDRETQDRLMLSFADALAPGGFLVLGKVESILGSARVRFELVEPRERIYCRAA